MNYVASVTDFFKSPKWFMNMLLGGLCALIPFVGLMVVLGWAVAGFWARREESFESFPPFEFSQFDKYLERGLWPVLITLIPSIIMVPLIWLMMIPAMVLGAFSSGSESSAAGCLGGVVIFAFVLLIAIVILISAILMGPLVLRASMMQDFSKAFDLRFAKRFLALTWKETLLSLLFVFGTGFLFSFLGMMLFCVGMYLATVLSYFSWMHLEKQLYFLYLSRGGEAVPLSPKLVATPPAFLA